MTREIKQNRLLAASTLLLLLISLLLLLAGCRVSSINQPVSGSPNPVPTINSVDPSCAPAGGPFIGNNLLDVGGLNFVAGSVVRWNGTDLPTTFDSNSGGEALTAQIPASDIAAAGTATVAVFNPSPGGGSSNSLTFTITAGALYPQSIAVDPAGKFAYVANAVGCIGGDDGYVSVYTIDPTTGALTSIGAASSQGINANSVTVDPFGKFAYVANSGDAFGLDDGSVAMYTINATTGALTSIGAIDGNCPGLCNPLSVVVDPSGKFAYVANGDVNHSVVIYTVSPTTGSLTPTGTIDVGGFANSVAVDPTDKFVYVATASAPGSVGKVSMYTINTTTGALASIGTIAAGTTPLAIAVDPTGKFAYVSNSGSQDISMYTINATTGALTSIGTTTVGGGFIAVHPSGKFVYVMNFAGSVSMYAIDATTGTLTFIGTTGAAGSSFFDSIAIHPSGKFAYVTNFISNNVSMYTIDVSSGAFTLIGTTGS